MEEFFASHRQGDQFIQLDLDDNPVRALYIPTEKVPVTSLLNFSNHVIQLEKGEALVYDQQEIAYWDTFMKTLQDQYTADLTVEDYRSWKELSNLEQAYLPTFGKQSELIYQLIAIDTVDETDSEAAQIIKEELAWSGSESTMFPETQTDLDKLLYDNIQNLQPIWAKLANYDTNNPEDRALLEDLLTQNEQLSMQLNNILTHEHKDFIEAEDYISLYEDM